MNIGMDFKLLMGSQRAILAILGVVGMVWNDGVGAEESYAFMSRVRQLIYEGSRSGEGYFSPDGNRLIFQSERDPNNPFYQIFTVDLSSGDIHPVSPGIGKTTCGFFRPGFDEVLFSSTHHDPGAQQKQEIELAFRASGQQRRYSWDYDEFMDIFSATGTGTGFRQLTSAPGYDAEAAYSPDGTHIVFCSNRHAYSDSSNLSPEEKLLLETDKSYFGEIYIMNADGSNQSRLTYQNGYDGGPFFSPDGQSIVWRRFDESGVIADIYTMKPDGSNQRQLTNFSSMSWAPYFHPSGEYIIFASNKFGFANFELFIVDVEGRREPVRVTEANGFDGLPVFSPDGKKISWTSNRTDTGKSQLFLASWNHLEALAAIHSSPQVRKVSPEIRPEDLRASVGYLADDSLNGRLAGSPDAGKSADYIRSRLEAAGVEPGNENSYFQEYPFTRGIDIHEEGTSMEIISRESTDEIILNKGFRPLPFSASGTIQAEVVFGGYGLSLPAEGGVAIDPYGGADVRGKIVLIFRYIPEDVPLERRAELNRYSGLRYKALIARQRGAAALLVVTGPNSPGAGNLVGLSDDGSLTGSGIPAASISLETAEAIVHSTGKSLKELQSGLDNENPHASNGLLIPELKMSLSIHVSRRGFSDLNVIGIIHPTGGIHAESDRRIILLGAHYDHLGRGESGGSRQTSEEHDPIHNGADDNASGVALLLELADYFSDPSNRSQLAAPVALAFWGGEELGLLGSARFVENPTIPLESIKAYLNFDMVGRLRDYKLTLQGLGSSSQWRKYIERANISAGFDLQLQDDPYLPTDTTSIYPAEIPVLSFFTGSHDDYHRPSDDTDTLNYEGLAEISSMALSLIKTLSSPESRLTYNEFTNQSQSGGSRDQLRIYLGTIPDYATETQGLRLTGVSSGGPAALAGIQAGDVIVELAGQKIANIYDYTYAIDSLKVDLPTPVKINRAGSIIELKIIPKAR